MGDFNIQSTAFVGVIAKDKGIAHFQLFNRSINGSKFVEFLHGLKFRHGRRPLAIYMDNLQVHYAKEVKEAYEELNIIPIYGPAYSPEYNPIEMVFNMLKQPVKKWRLEDMLKRRKRTYKDLVPLAVRHCTIDKVNKCIDKVLGRFGIN